MILSKLQIDNVLGLKIHMADLDSIVKLVGPNRAGKSRIITCILALFKYDSLPMKKRQALLAEDGTITGETKDVEKGNWRITRTIKEGKPGLKVKRLDQKAPAGGKSTLDAFCGENFVDLAKLRDPKKTEEAVLDMLGLTEPLKELKEKRQEIFDARTGIGQDRNRVGFDPEGEEPEEVEEVNLSELLKEQKEAMAHNNYIESVERDAKNDERQIQKLRTELEEAEKRKQKRIETLRQLESINTADLEDDISSAEQTNQKARDRHAWEEKKIEWHKHDELYKDRTSFIEGLDFRIQKKINEADWPIEGLSYHIKDGLTMDGHTFISDGEYRRLAYEIVRRLKGDMTFCTFENFSLLDPENKQEVLEDAKAAGYQIFVELVTGDPMGDDGFFIEEGEVIDHVTD